MANITNIPAPRVDFIDPRTGLMSREWYRFFLSLFELTGSGSNPVSLTDFQVGPPNVSIEDVLATHSNFQTDPLAASNDDVAVTNQRIKSNKVLTWLSM